MRRPLLDVAAVQHVLSSIVKKDGCGASQAADGYKNGKFNHGADPPK
jgi:hypothetical protein